MVKSFIFPNRRWYSKIVWKRVWNPKIHANAGPTCKKRRSLGAYREVRRGLIQETKPKMTQRPAMIFGQSKGTSFIVITSNLEFSSTCKHDTKPTHTSRSRTRDFFSRGSRLESSSQQELLCLTKQSFFTSSAACHARPRCCFLDT